MKPMNANELLAGLALARAGAHHRRCNGLPQGAAGLHFCLLPRRACGRP